MITQKWFVWILINYLVNYLKWKLAIKNLKTFQKADKFIEILNQHNKNYPEFIAYVNEYDITENLKFKDAILQN